MAATAGALLQNRHDRYYKSDRFEITDSPQVKSVDYLSNALMELAAKNSGSDTAIAVDTSGNITEGSNKNVVIVGKDGIMRVPPYEKILRGTTLTRALEFADKLKRRNLSPV